ncbi:MAG: M20/M25/M40 family metallo-hydrolase, partial [Candidatus Acidiferrales bacterium]
LSQLMIPFPGKMERIEVAPGRWNVFAHWGEPVVTLSSHMDTVPPFVSFREDEEFIWGRGACDAKGIIASMILAAESLLREGVRSFGLLFVVGEERDSAGAIAAGKMARGSRYLINGEPTENLLVRGSKGALRYEIRTRGKTAHSAYPELGHSAIEDLLACLNDIRSIPLAHDPLLGSSTLNIGTLTGGRAPNVVPDFAAAELMFRLVGDPAAVREGMRKAVGDRGELKEVLYSEALKFRALEGFRSTVVSFTTDIPFLQGTWGQPFLIGPGSIHVAHTQEQRIAKQDLLAAVEIYSNLVKMLLAGG